MNDENELKRIYANIKSLNYDYLNIDDTTNFNWNIFNEKYEFDQFYIFFEKFEHVEDIRSNDSLESKYTITTQNGSIFHVSLNKILNSSKILDEAMTLSRAKGKNLENIKQYQYLYDLIKNNPNKNQLFIYFKDDNGNTKLTNRNLENESFVIFKSLQNAIKHFILVGGHFNDINIIRFLVDKNEKKRLELYKRIIKKLDEYINMPNILIDDVNNPTYNTITIY